MRAIIPILFLLISFQIYAQDASFSELQTQLLDVEKKIDKESEKVDALKKNLDVLQEIKNSLVTDTSSVYYGQNIAERIIFLKSLDSSQFNFRKEESSNSIFAINDYVFFPIYSIQDFIIQKQQSNISFPELDELSSKINLLRNNTAYVFSYNSMTIENKLLWTKDIESAILNLQIINLNAQRYSLIQKLIELGENAYNSISQSILASETSLGLLEKQKVELLAEISTGEDNTWWVFIIGFPMFMVFILILYLVPLWFLHKKQKEGDSTHLSFYANLYSSGMLLEVITVLLLTSMILLLGLTDKLQPEVLGTLIGGISGYVLGRSFKANGHQNGNSSSSNSPSNSQTGSSSNSSTIVP